MRVRRGSACLIAWMWSTTALVAPVFAQSDAPSLVAPSLDDAATPDAAITAVDAADRAADGDATVPADAAAADAAVADGDAQPAAPTRSDAKAPAVTTAPPGPYDGYARFGILTGSLALFAGIYFYAEASAQSGELEMTCVRDTCPRSAQSTIDAVDRKNLIGGIGSLVGLALLGTGLWLYTVKPPPPRPDGATVTLRVGPTGVWGQF